MSDSMAEAILTMITEMGGSVTFAGGPGSPE